MESLCWYYQIKPEKQLIQYQFPDLTFTNLIANQIMSQTCQFTVLPQFSLILWILYIFA